MTVQIGTVSTTPTGTEVIGTYRPRAIDWDPNTGRLWVAYKEANGESAFHVRYSDDGGATWTAPSSGASRALSSSVSGVGVGLGTQRAWACVVDEDGIIWVLDHRNGWSALIHRGVFSSGAVSWSTLTVDIPNYGYFPYTFSVVKLPDGRRSAQWIEAYDGGGGVGHLRAHIQVIADGALPNNATEVAATHSIGLGTGAYYPYGISGYSNDQVNPKRARLRSDGTRSPSLYFAWTLGSEHIQFFEMRWNPSTNAYEQLAGQTISSSWKHANQSDFFINNGKLCLVGHFPRAGTSTYDWMLFERDIEGGTTWTATTLVSGTNYTASNAHAAHDPDSQDVVMISHSGMDVGTHVLKRSDGTVSARTNIWTAPDTMQMINSARYLRGSKAYLLALHDAASPYTITSVVKTYNLAPYAPTLTSPANAAVVDLAAGATFQATVNDPNTGDTATAYKFRRKISGAASYEYWNATTVAWQTTEVWNTVAETTTISVTFGAGLWTNGNTYNWSIATRDVGGLEGPYATDSSVVASTPASVTVTDPAGSADTSRPMIRWSVADPEGEAVERYHVKLFDSATFTAAGFDPATSTPVWTTGDVAGSVTAVETGVDLENGTTYRPYVRVRTNTQWSAWAYNAFTVSLEPPAVPTVSAVFEAALARVAVTVQGRDNMLTANQGSVETDTAGLIAYTNCSVARTTDQAAHGSASLRMTATNAANMGAATTNGLGSVPITPGRTYTAQAMFRAAVTGRAVWLRLQWQDAAGNETTGVESARVTDTTTGWVLVTVTGVAPAGAARAFIKMNVGAPAASEQHYVDKISLVPGTVNLLDANQASIETDASGWMNGRHFANNTRARTTDVAFMGAAALSITSNGTYANMDVSQTPYTAVVAGFTYTASVYVRAATADRTVQVSMVWHDAANAFISETPKVEGVDRVGSWTRITITATAPTGAALLRLNVLFASVASGEVHYLDAAQIEQAAAASPWKPPGWTPGGFAGASVFRLQFSDDEGGTWQTVRNGTDVAHDGSATQQVTVYDAEAPAEQPRLYRARAAVTV